MKNDNNGCTLPWLACAKNRTPNVTRPALAPGAPCTPAAVEATEAEAVELPVEDFAVVQA